MRPGQYERLAELFLQGVRVPSGDREGWLAGLDPADAVHGRLLRSMLEHDDCRGKGLDPGVDLAALAAILNEILSCLAATDGDRSRSPTERARARQAVLQRLLPPPTDG